MISSYNIISESGYNDYKDENGEWYKREDVEKLKKLFNKYINFVTSREGIDYLEYLCYEKEYQLTEEETKMIEEIKLIHPYNS